jgi:hypothetical protein
MIAAAARSKKKQDNVKRMIEEVEALIEKESSPSKLSALKARRETLHEIWDGYNYTYNPRDHLNVLREGTAK